MVDLSCPFPCGWSLHPLPIETDPPDGAPPFQPSDLSVFLISDGRGVNYRKGLWHLPLCTLFETGRFLVVDRGGPGDNCDQYHLSGDARITVEIDPPR